MLQDLSTVVEQTVVRHTEVCVIGAGTAGIFLAQALRALGVRVAILEAGGRDSKFPDPSTSCRQVGSNYRGADHGRSFGLGGTSVAWGGQLISVSPTDVAARSFVGLEAWPITYDELSPFFVKAATLLGLPDLQLGEDNEPDTRRFPDLLTLSDKYHLRLSTWLPFGKRNFAQSFAESLLRDHHLDVWLNAAVVALDYAKHPSRHRATAVRASSRNGKTLVVNADYVVLCAGALESTRLAMAFDESSHGLITWRGAPLGRYFSDHISLTAGHFDCHNWAKYNRAVAPIFSRGLMRTPRLELTGRTQESLKVTSAFAHFTFVTRGDTGFDAVRSWLRRRQGEQLQFKLSPGLIGKAAQDLAALSYWKTVHRRLWIPRQATLLLQIDIEQIPNWNNRLLLADERDELGRKHLIVDWRVMPEDMQVFRAVAEVTVRAWNESPLQEAARLVGTLPDAFDKFGSLYDVYHPTGTLRMGRSAETSVVDKDLRVWEIDNFYISSTAVFPSAGSANPGLTHLALTARLAQHLAKRLRH